MDNNIVTFPKTGPHNITFGIKMLVSPKMTAALENAAQLIPYPANTNALGDMVGDITSVLRKDARRYVSEVHRDIILGHKTPLAIDSKWEFCNFAWALTTELRDCIMGRGREFEQSYLALDNAAEALANAIYAIKELRGV